MDGLKRRVFLLSLALFIVLLFSPLSAAQGPVRVQLGFIIDGSQSIPDTQFTLITHGIARALNDPTIVPRDGTVEICIVKFGYPGSVDQVRIEQGPIVITDATIGYVVDRLRAIQEGHGETPMAQAIRLCTDLIAGSSHFATAERHIINIATDGLPYDTYRFPDDPYGGAAADALLASNQARAAGIDELDAEVVGNPALWPGRMDFFHAVVFPQPAIEVPPGVAAPGFVWLAQTLFDFEGAVAAKLQGQLAETETPTATLTSTATWTAPPTDTATPEPSATPTETPIWTVEPTMTMTPGSPEPTEDVTPSLTPEFTAEPTDTVTPYQPPPATTTPTPTPPPGEVPEGNSLLLLSSGLGAPVGYLSLRHARKGRSHRDG